MLGGDGMVFGGSSPSFTTTLRIMFILRYGAEQGGSSGLVPGGCRFESCSRDKGFSVTVF